MTNEEIKIDEIPEIDEGDISGSTTLSDENTDVINVDNPVGTSAEFMEENFDILALIYKLLNSPEYEDQVEIIYSQSDDGKETANVFLDGEKHYFTDSPKEIENFHLWEQNKKNRAEQKLKKFN